MNKLKVFSILVILLFISCINDQQNRGDDTKKNDKVKEKQKLMIVGKQMKSLRKIVGDSVDLRNRVIFLYNGFDCQSCIDVGYSLTKNIDSLSNKQVVYVVATSTNIGRDQYRNKYYDFVYFDEHDLVRRELKYIYTPVILKLDSLNTIEDVLFPNNNRDMEEEALFLEKCVID